MPANTILRSRLVMQSIRAPLRLGGLWLWATMATTMSTLVRVVPDASKFNQAIERDLLGTRMASPNRNGLAKLRANWVYREVQLT